MNPWSRSHDSRPEPAVDALLEALEQLWDHPWESWVEVLRGVDAAEAAWAPDAVSTEGPLPPGSLHWHLNHLAGCKLAYIAEIRHAVDPSVVRRDNDQLEPAADFTSEFARLGQIHREHKDTVAGLTDLQLGRRTTDGRTLLEMIVAQTRHDIWHGGQMAVVRRRYRSRTQA